MNFSSSELAGALGRCQMGVAAVLRQAGGREQRAAGLSDLLRELLPAAVRTACLLVGEIPAPVAIRPESSAEEQERWRERLATLDPLAPAVQEFPSAEGGPTLAAAIHEDGRARGFLAIELPAAAPAEERARAEALLAVGAPATALRWDWETVRGEQAELAKFALLGQAFVGLAHELNNALNSMMLQTSVVQLRVDAQARNDLATIRQHGVQAAALVRSLQHVAQERREQAYAVDLNGVVTEVLADTPSLRGRVSARLAAEALRIPSTRSALKQLVRLLLDGLLAGTKAAVRIGTEKREDGIVLTLTMAELSAADELSPHEVLWQHLDEVGRYAGQSLIRQLGGTLTVDRADSEGWVVRVVWTGSA